MLMLMLMVIVPTQVILCLLSSLLDLGLLAKPRAADQNGNHHHHFHSAQCHRATCVWRKAEHDTSITTMHCNVINTLRSESHRRAL